MLPSMMSGLDGVESSVKVRATFESKSWNGAMPTPSFSSVPT